MKSHPVSIASSRGCTRLSITILSILIFGAVAGLTTTAAEPLNELPGGLVNAQRLDLAWIEGEWQHFARGVESQIEITRTDTGVYTIESADPMMDSSKLYLFRAGCERLALLEVGEPGTAQIMVARVSGYSERLSLDLVPAMFPMAWSDPELKAQLGVDAGGELPKEYRLEAVEHLAQSIDTKGTFMLQDFTYYRPESLQELRQSLDIQEEVGED